MGESYKLVRVEGKPSFFKKHSKWVSFVGALIVFCTFVVKENLLENWKAISDGIVMAEYVYQIRTDTDASAEYYIKLRDRIVNLARQSGTPVPVKTTVAKKVQEATETCRNFTLQSITLYSAIDVLMDKLPDKKALHEISGKGWVEAIDLKERCRALEPDIQSIASHEMLPDQGRTLPGPSLYDYLNQSADINKQTKEVYDKADKFRSEVLKRVEKIREDNRSKSESAKKVSVVLYTLGWGLGLVGKLFGGGDIMGGD